MAYHVLSRKYYPDKWGRAFRIFFTIVIYIPYWDNSTTLPDYLLMYLFQLLGNMLVDRMELAKLKSLNLDQVETPLQIAPHANLQNV